MAIPRRRGRGALDGAASVFKMVIPLPCEDQRHVRHLGLLQVVRSALAPVAARHGHTSSLRSIRLRA
jgi:hypothetical protein